VYPALAIADEIRRRHPDAQLLYVGMRGKLESWVVPEHGYALRFVHARPLPRPASALALVVFAGWVAIGVAEGVALLARYRPDLIVGTGGYGSAPVFFAHALLSRLGLSRARAFVYEPNAHPGLLNQVVGRTADRVGVAFERAARWFDMRRVAVVGYPVRRQVAEGTRAEGRRRLDIAPDREVLLVFGGSAGSRAINRALVAALPRLRQRPQLLVLHITGRPTPAGYDAVADTEARLAAAGIAGDTSDWYRRYEYMHDIHHAYHAADLVVCRGGAGTLTEVARCGLPAVIVPLSTAADDHQAMNARELERLGAARVLYERAAWADGDVVSVVDPGELAATVLELLDDPPQRQRMAAAARARPIDSSLRLLLDEVERLLSGQRPPPLSLEFPTETGGLPADPNQLLRHVRARLAAVNGPDGLERAELAYLRYQADRLLVSPAWYEIPLGRRNVGVKLVGCLRYEEQLPLLLAMLADRQPVSWLRRLCGGDYRHGGLLRRNIIELGLVPLGIDTPQVRDALLAILRADPYFEARAAAASALGVLGAPDAEAEAALVEALDDPSAAVVVEALKALGAVGVSRTLLPRLHRFYLAGHWPYRLKLVEALIRLLQRGVVAREDLAGQLDQILATSSFFVPEFPLNERLRQLAELLGPAAPSEAR